MNTILIQIMASSLSERV